MQSLRSSSIVVSPAPLTAEAFQPYGSLITSPLPPTTSKLPHPPPQGTISANQNTAIKCASIAPLSSTYHLSPSGIPAKPVMSMFSCFPRALRRESNAQGKKSQFFDVKIIERHPYTTQTFVPMGAPSSDNTRCLIIVAPTLPTPPVLSSGTPYFPQASSSTYRQNYGGMPDIHNMKAFITEPGVVVGVTYGVGTWHSPMVVIGDGRVDFVVSQWMSGRSEEDCQEAELGEGISILVDGEESVGRAKL